LYISRKRRDLQSIILDYRVEIVKRFFHTSSRLKHNAVSLRYKSKSQQDIPSVSSFFDVRHLRCVITKLNSNWETVINTTKVSSFPRIVSLIVVKF
jgi:hypothetical protein